MSLHGDLLIQAGFLALREPKRPRQASLRRAVSAAYYAIFHLLTSETSRLFAKDDRIIAAINRAYAHGDMNTVSKAVAAGNFPKSINPLKATFAVPPKLQSVAKTFVDLQQARHEADYNLGKTFTRSEALALISQVKQAFTDWEDVRKDHYARLYLACFLLWQKWDLVR